MDSQNTLNVLTLQLAMELIAGDSTGNLVVLNKIPESEVNGRAKFTLVYENTDSGDIYSFPYSLRKVGEGQYHINLTASDISNLVGAPLVDVTKLSEEIPDTVDEILNENPDEGKSE